MFSVPHAMQIKCCEPHINELVLHTIQAHKESILINQINMFKYAAFGHVFKLFLITVRNILTQWPPAITNYRVMI